MRALMLLGVVLVASAASAGPAQRTETKEYIAATFVPPEVFCSYYATAWSPPQGAYQQACFSILDGEGNVSLLITDEAAAHVHGWFLFKDAKGNPGPATYFCDSASGRVPPDSSVLYVVLWGFENECMDGHIVQSVPLQVPRVTTVGTLSATFQP